MMQIGLAFRAFLIRREDYGSDLMAACLRAVLEDAHTRQPVDGLLLLHDISDKDDARLNHLSINPTQIEPSPRRRINKNHCIFTIALHKLLTTRMGFCSDFDDAIADC